MAPFSSPHLFTPLWGSPQKAKGHKHGKHAETVEQKFMNMSNIKPAKD